MTTLVGCPVRSARSKGTFHSPASPPRSSPAAWGFPLLALLMAALLPAPSTSGVARDAGPTVTAPGAPVGADLANNGLPTRLFTVTPCRVADTRRPAGPSGGPALAANAARTFPVVGICGVPSTATAIAANVTVVEETDYGHLRVYPAGGAPPGTSTINFTPGKVRANNAVVALGQGGQVIVECHMPPGSTGRLHFVLDVTGLFAAGQVHPVITTSRHRNDALPVNAHRDRSGRPVKSWAPRSPRSVSAGRTLNSDDPGRQIQTSGMPIPAMPRLQIQPGRMGIILQQQPAAGVGLDTGFDLHPGRPPVGARELRWGPSNPFSATLHRDGSPSCRASAGLRSTTRSHFGTDAHANVFKERP
jgi:hypothetical protein